MHRMEKSGRNNLNKTKDILNPYGPQFECEVYISMSKLHVCVSVSRYNKTLEISEKLRNRKPHNESRFAYEKNVTSSLW